MAKKMIRPLRSEADYDAALVEIERYFEKEPPPGSAEADRSTCLRSLLRTMSARAGRSMRPIRSRRFATGWKRGD